MWWVDRQAEKPRRRFGQGDDQIQAREAVVNESLPKTAPNAKPNRVWQFGEFVERGLFPLLQPEVERIDAGKQREQGIGSSCRPFRDRELSGFRRDELQDLLDAKAKRPDCRFR